MKKEPKNTLDDFLEHNKDKKNALKKIVKELDKKEINNSKTK
ncbi:hypothetical protein [Cochleicola gelatinilyticus]|nr:hypothetical protein [Cochleicola gelatinilyticus]